MLLSADWVIPVSSAPIAGGAVRMEGGVIVEVAPAAELRARHPIEELREYPGCALVPGFVNVHTHLDYSAFRGFPASRGFLRWILRLTKARKRLTAQDLEASALWGAHECLRHGVTSIADTSYGGATVAKAALATGLRARVYVEVFGLDDARLAETVQRLQEALETAKDAVSAAQGSAAGSAEADPGGAPAGAPPTQSGLLEWGVSPHAPYTVSQQLYREVARLARAKGLRLATHVAESKTEVRLLTGGASPLAVLYRTLGVLTGSRWKLSRKRPVDYLAEAGALGPDMLAVHVVQVDEHDIATLAASGTPIAHCPRSNLRLDCGVAPVARMRRAGLVVALGTDSLASNEDLDMLAEMRAALRAGEEVAARESVPALSHSAVLQMATLDGARALGWEQQVGSLEAGKRADLAVVELAAPLPLHASPDDLAAAVMSGTVTATLVGGVVAFAGAVLPGEVVAGFDAARAKVGLRD